MAGVIKTKSNPEVMRLFKDPDLKSIQPMKARVAFARALVLENEAGKTTPEALALLDEAIRLQGV